MIFHENKARIRLLLLVLAIAFMPVLLWAKDGVLSGAEGKIRVTKTEYFDIIYTDDSAASAQKIAKVCDSFYREICGYLETKPYQRFPVTITHQVEAVNAYFSAYPYNRIVLFDTYPDSLDMYEHTIESIFYHELTHAVTMNMKSSFFKSLSVFSDAANPAWATLATFWLEGATVFFESRTKSDSSLPHGRLNSPYSTLLVLQSKIDGRFPSWADVTGARDTYPGGNDAYMFGGAFVSYLHKKYGAKKYAQFWKKSGSMLLFPSLIFKRTYGVSLNDAWKDFRESLEVPVVKSPDSIPESKVLISKKQQRRFSCFDSSRAGFVYYDKSSSCVKFCKYDGASSSYSKPKKLVTVGNLNHLSMTDDASYLLLSRYTVRDNVKDDVVLYDVKKHFPFHVREKGLLGASFIGGDDKKLCFAAARIEKGRSYLATFSFDKKTHDINKTSEIEFGEDEFPYSITGAGEEKLALIMKSGLAFTIRVYDANLEGFTEYELSRGESDKLPIFHNLHALVLADGRTAFTFSYAALGMSGKMFPRAGVLLDGKMYLQNEDVSGGVLECFPLADFSDDNFSLGIVGEHFSYNDAYSVVLSKKGSERSLKVASGSVAVYEKSSSGSELAKNTDDESFSIGTKRYNPFSYAFRGTLLPLANNAVYNHDLEPDLTNTSALGLTFITTNPWMSQTFLVSGGWFTGYGCYSAMAQFTGGNDGFSYSISGNVTGDKKGFMQTAENISAEKLIFYGLSSRLSAGLAADYFYRRQIIDSGFSDNVDDTKLLHPRAQVYLNWTNRHKAGRGVYDIAGRTLTPFMLASLRRSEYLGYDRKYCNPGAKVTLEIPILLPFTFTASFFPSDSYFASAGVNAVLFCHEIQRGIPYAQIYAYRFVVTAGYTGKFAYESQDCLEVRNTRKIIKHLTRDDYSDAMNLKAFVVLAPNFGAFASEIFQCSLGGSFIYRFHPEDDERRAELGFLVDIAL